ncbi:MAG: hypothetical protein K1X67_25590 [Fimbriimonadaceae bacterium]|nr:hypothetical protein [Fimbriimonadaceae bacterium]
MLIPAIVFADYELQKIEGWPVQVETKLIADHRSTWEAVRRELGNQLYRITRVVPDGPLSKLRQVTIWVHWDDPGAPCMAYHPAAAWLREHKVNPAMEKGVELANAKNFLSWTYEQPWMVMHELAHAYHHQFLDKGFENADVATAWKRITESKKYESVLHYDGKNAKHYALNNPMEYFAETTESYFGRNDFFPFVNAELKTFDSESEELMRRIWGPVQKRLMP